MQFCDKYYIYNKTSKKGKVFIVIIYFLSQFLVDTTADMTAVMIV